MKLIIEEGNIAMVLMHFLYVRSSYLSNFLGRVRFTSQTWKENSAGHILSYWAGG